jgi:hypothetical protein
MKRASVIVLASGIVLLFACGSSGRDGFDTDPTLPGPGGGAGECGACGLGTVCVPGKGCLPCVPGQLACSGNEVHRCDDQGQLGELVETCDPSRGMACADGKCATACEAAASAQSNVGCEFWPVDLDLSDGVSNPGGGPWGLVLSNASQIPANVRVEKNTAPVGAPLALETVYSSTIPVGQLVQVDMPQAITDCGTTSDDHASPGTCLTSTAFRVTSSAPIVAYQFNNMVHNYSTDASLLLPTPVLGQVYRAIGWGSGSPFAVGPIYVQRAYVTVVGTQPGTQVTVNPSWRIKGNGPVPATAPGGSLTVTLGPFDVLNLESDDATMAECTGPAHVKPPYCTDLTGTVVQSSAPVAVFSGTESSGVGPPDDAPKPPDWNENSGCCKQHLEEQLPPLESIGKSFVVTRSPIRSKPFAGYVEPDVLRFVGAAATAEVTTNLKAPFDHFTIEPGQIMDTWTDRDVVVTATEPILIGQFLVAQDYVTPTPKGDPSMTIVPPVEQQRNEYVFLSPDGWSESWVVISAVVGTKVTIDGEVPSDCVVAEAGTLDGKVYEARRCPLSQGVHSLSGDAGFGIMAYGYNDADAYSFPGGAFVKKIYHPPPIR